METAAAAAPVVPSPLMVTNPPAVMAFARFLDLQHQAAGATPPLRLVVKLVFGQRWKYSAPATPQGAAAIVDAMRADASEEFTLRAAHTIPRPMNAPNAYFLFTERPSDWRYERDFQTLDDVEAILADSPNDVGLCLSNVSKPSDSSSRLHRWQT